MNRNTKLRLHNFPEKFKLQARNVYLTLKNLKGMKCFYFFVFCHLSNLLAICHLSNLRAIICHLSNFLAICHLSNLLAICHLSNLLTPAKMFENIDVWSLPSSRSRANKQY